MNSRVLIKDPKGEYVDFKGWKVNSTKAMKNETIWMMPEYFGRGEFKNLRFQSGLDITFSHCTLKKDYHARVEQARPMITFVFSLSGRTCTKNSSHGKNIKIAEDDNYVHHFQDPILHRAISCKKIFQGLVIRMDPDVFEKMMLNDFTEPSASYASTVRKIAKNHYFSSHKTTPKMKIILFQMITCPHRGIVRKIFLESKAMELIGYKIEQIFEDIHRKDTPRTLSPEDRDRVYFAQDIIAARFQNPPLLPELAKAVGMTHTKLNQCFRETFGCTVFDYFRRKRLEYASLLLCENKMSITDVAFEAGFCSSSHFTSSFVKHQGVTPRVYRKNNSTGYRIAK